MERAQRKILPKMQRKIYGVKTSNSLYINCEAEKNSKDKLVQQKWYKNCITKKKKRKNVVLYDLHAKFKQDLKSQRKMRPKSRNIHSEILKTRLEPPNSCQLPWWQFCFKVIPPEPTLTCGICGLALERNRIHTASQNRSVHDVYITFPWGWQELNNILQDTLIYDGDLEFP